MNKKLKIKKSKLNGTLKLSGAKNCALKLLTASILTEDHLVIQNSPNDLLDMQIHIEMLNQMGKECIVDKDILSIKEISIKPELIWKKRSIRNSLLILGALTTRFGYGMVPLPGGCKLGDRKYDLHVMVLENFGAKVWEEEGYLFTKADGKLRGSNIYLPFRSTGATENAIICGCLAIGKTTIYNPHVRPEIIDLIKMLNSMGAKIKVFGQRSIEIIGVSHLKGTKHRCINDNMEALTWAIATSVAGGELQIMDFPFHDLEVPLIFLRESGMKFVSDDKSLIVEGSQTYPIDISTGPYPGINSDMQPLFAIYGANSFGISKIIDLRFPGRYAYASELSKMGVDFEIKDNLLVINGGNKLIGNRVKALDLRAGAALLIAGLKADGITEIEDAWQIMRGYENIEKKLELITDISFS